jgi:hypothetical protein
MWKRGDWKTFCGMLPEYAAKGHGEGFMHDTAMLMGALGWSAYDAPAEVSHRTSAPRAPGRSTPSFRSRRKTALPCLGRWRPVPTATPPLPRACSRHAAPRHPLHRQSRRRTDMSALCRRLADTMLAQRDEAGKPVFPPGGTRVLAYPAPHFAMADGGAAGRLRAGIGDYGFVYLQPAHGPWPQPQPCSRPSARPEGRSQGALRRPLLATRCPSA